MTFTTWIIFMLNFFVLNFENENDFVYLELGAMCSTQYMTI